MDKKVPQLNMNRMKSGEYVRNIWVVTVESGVTKEDLTDVSFWAHVARSFKPYDHIEVRTDDGAYYAEFLVLSCDRTWAKVHEIRYVEFTKTSQEQYL
jgi:hypothetical protein